MKNIDRIVRYYAVGIFKGEPHPFKPTRERKHNPMQAQTYLGVTVVVTPLIWLSGLAYLFYIELNAAGYRIDLATIAFVHTLGAFLMLESRAHAEARGAKIYAEIVGYGATSDGYDMVAPSGEGAIRCMQMAMSTVDTPIDYLNTHGTSTPVGDAKEMEGVRAVFGDKAPKISSTKSLSGHSLGAAGVHEAIYCLLMMEGNFIAASANIDELDPEVADMPILRQVREDAKLDTVMSNSFGFGGTNATLVLQRFKG